MHERDWVHLKCMLIGAMSIITEGRRDILRQDIRKQADAWLKEYDLAIQIIDKEKPPG